MLKLDEFFYEMKDEAYVIAKLSKDFPSYLKGEDIDIFCYDLKKISRIILKLGNKYVSKSREIKVRTISKTHVQIDFFESNEIEFRFDVYSGFSSFKKTQIKDNYIDSVIENSREVKRKYGKEQYGLKVPSEIDEMIIRYVDYLEWIQLRKDKEKHLEYISSKVEEKNRKKFLNKLERYVSLNKNDYDGWQTKLKVGQILRALYRKTRLFFGKVLRRIHGS